MDGDKQIERQTKTRERQAGRKTDRQTGRQADRQIYTTCIGLFARHWWFGSSRFHYWLWSCWSWSFGISSSWMLASAMKGRTPIRVHPFKWLFQSWTWFDRSSHWGVLLFQTNASGDSGATNLGICWVCHRSEGNGIDIPAQLHIIAPMWPFQLVVSSSSHFPEVMNPIDFHIFGQKWLGTNQCNGGPPSYKLVYNPV